LVWLGPAISVIDPKPPAALPITHAKSIRINNSPAPPHQCVGIKEQIESLQGEIDSIADGENNKDAACQVPETNAIMTRTVASRMLALFFVAAGLNHFLNPAPYWSMMPAYLPCPRALNIISGAAEIAGGAGIVFPATRLLAGWGLLALLVAVFPANLNVALHGWKGENIAPWLLWARLPLQPLMMALVYWACIARRSQR
jgi:uncharacterized membrane protein